MFTKSEKQQKKQINKKQNKTKQNSNITLTTCRVKPSNKENIRYTKQIVRIM